MGVVYRAHDERLDRDVALKILPLGVLVDEATRKRFRQEALTLSKLSDSNIAHVYDFDTQAGIDFLVMEFVSGVTLADKLARGSLLEKEVVNFGEQIAKTLEDAHEAGVIHRDLKPANIMCTKKGGLKLLDFGLATLLRAGDTDLTESRIEGEAAVGTLLYAAPEQLRGERPDPRVDIYALGVVLYQLATGRRPFEGNLSTAVLDDILHKSPIPPGRFQANLSPRLEEIILKCLEKDPGLRYQSARELAVDLERIKPGRSTSSFVGAAPVPKRWLWYVSGALAAALILLASLWYFGPWREKSGGLAAGEQIHSLAVLPLENFSGGTAQEYFADGMTEELITRLSTISSLRVISRTSVMQYKGVHKSLPQIAKELNVDAVVEGSVMRSGNQVRITAQLIQAANDKHLWAESYDRELQDVLGLQSEVARDIAGQVRAQLTPQEQVHLGRSDKVQPAALDAYVKGRYYLNQRTPEALKTSLAYFQQAIEADPSFAAPYAAQGTFYTLASFYGLRPNREALPLARSATLKALQLDESLSEGHATLGEILFYYDHDFGRAESELKRAIALNPGNADAHNWYAMLLISLLRNPEALQEVKRAYELDPLAPAYTVNYGYFEFLAGEQEAGIRRIREYLSVNPQFAAHGHWQLGKVYAFQGNYGEAIGEFRHAVDATPDSPRYLCWLAYSYGISGNKPEAARLIERVLALARTRPIQNSDLAIAYTGLGDKRKALDWLERGFQEYDPWVVFIGYERTFDSLRSEPRFKALVHRLNLPSSVEARAVR